MVRPKNEVTPPSERIIHNSVACRYIGQLTHSEFDIIDYLMIHPQPLDRRELVTGMGLTQKSMEKNTQNMRRAGLLTVYRDTETLGIKYYDSFTSMSLDVELAAIPSMIIPQGRHGRGGPRLLYLNECAYKHWHEALGENYDEYRHYYTGRLNALERAIREASRVESIRESIKARYQKRKRRKTR